MSPTKPRIVLRDVAVAKLLAVRQQVLVALLPRLGRAPRHDVPLPGLEDEAQLEQVVVPLVGHVGRLSRHAAAVRLALGFDEAAQLGVVDGDLQMALRGLEGAELLQPIGPAQVRRAAGGKDEAGVLQLHQLVGRQVAVPVLLEELVLVPLLGHPLGQLGLVLGVDVGMAVLLLEG